MSRFLVSMAALMIATLAAVSGLAISAGQVGEAAPLDTAPDCQIPCWNGIHPGQTTMHQASAILKRLGYELLPRDDDPGINVQLSYGATRPATFCQADLSGRRFRDLVVRELVLRACESLPLGRVLDRLGLPDSMLPIASTLIFQEGQIIITLRLPICDMKPSPHALIRYINLSEIGINAEVIKQPADLPWHGFVPLWRYGQLYPNKTIC